MLFRHMSAWIIAKRLTVLGFAVTSGRSLARETGSGGHWSLSFRVRRAREVSGWLIMNNQQTVDDLVRPNRGINASDTGRAWAGGAPVAVAHVFSEGRTRVCNQCSAWRATSARRDSGHFSMRGGSVRSIL